MCALALTMAISTSVIVAPNASAQSSDLSSGSSSSSSDSNKSSGSSGSSDLWERILKLLGRSKIVPLIMQVSPGIITKKMGDILGRGMRIIGIETRRIPRASQIMWEPWLAILASWCPSTRTKNSLLSLATLSAETALAKEIG